MSKIMSFALSLAMLAVGTTLVILLLFWLWDKIDEQVQRWKVNKLTKGKHRSLDP